MQWNWNVWCSLGRICSLHFRSGWPASYFCGTQTLCCSCTGPTSVQLIAQLNLSTCKKKNISGYSADIKIAQLNLFIFGLFWKFFWQCLKLEHLVNGKGSIHKIEFFRMAAHKKAFAVITSYVSVYTDIEWHKNEITRQENLSEYY